MKYTWKIRTFILALGRNVTLGCSNLAFNERGLPFLYPLWNSYHTYTKVYLKNGGDKRYRTPVSFTRPICLANSAHHYQGFISRMGVRKHPFVCFQFIFILYSIIKDLLSLNSLYNILLSFGNITLFYFGNKKPLSVKIGVTKVLWTPI